MSKKKKRRFTNAQRRQWALRPHPEEELAPETGTEIDGSNEENPVVEPPLFPECWNPASPTILKGLEGWPEDPVRPRLSSIDHKLQYSHLLN